MVEKLTLMNKQKILNDIAQSAINMKAHYDTWWAFVHHGRLGEDYKNALLKNSDFIRVTEQAHYISMFIYFAHLFDSRSDVSSIPMYLSKLKQEIDSSEYCVLEHQYKNLRAQALPILKVRHKLIAHIDSQLSELDVFQQIGMSWDEIFKVINETAEFVSKLNSSNVTPRDGRLSEAVMTALKRLSQ